MMMPCSSKDIVKLKRLLSQTKFIRHKESVIRKLKNPSLSSKTFVNLLVYNHFHETYSHSVSNPCSLEGRDCRITRMILQHLDPLLPQHYCTVRIRSKNEGTSNEIVIAVPHGSLEYDKDGNEFIRTTFLRMFTFCVDSPPHIQVGVPCEQVFFTTPFKSDMWACHLLMKMKKNSGVVSL